MKKISLITLLTLFVAAGVITAQRTTRRNLIVTRDDRTVTSAAHVYTDTLASPEPHLVDINGYDKPLRSRRETFFVTNNGSRAVEGVALTIKYYDTRQRMLHSASHNVRVDIPPTETRQVNLSSWDKQFNFYYRNSAVPRHASHAVPYDVAITIDTLFVSRQ